MQDPLAYQMDNLGDSSSDDLGYSAAALAALLYRGGLVSRTGSVALSGQPEYLAVVLLACKGIRRHKLADRYRLRLERLAALLPQDYWGPVLRDQIGGPLEGHDGDGRGEAVKQDGSATQTQGGGLSLPQRR